MGYSFLVRDAGHCMSVFNEWAIAHVIKIQFKLKIV